MTEQDNMTMQQYWNIYRLFPTYAEAEAAGMGQEWQDAEDAIHAHDYDHIDEAEHYYGIE